MTMSDIMRDRSSTRQVQIPQTVGVEWMRRGENAAGRLAFPLNLPSAISVLGAARHIVTCGSTPKHSLSRRRVNPTCFDMLNDKQQKSFFD
jgi:hypothetical protein